ncbi:BTB/POZ domain-containing protein 6-like [Lepeophtheirus salmonis]|uniref:BTB/POZ domain-containing protein 6-like n=1 Tax=Lepeophtheirus salmonis TaxID=72036 RepID=UPI001AE47C6C|nr:uncharacterized protein LOC121122902 [Lepeophtheirus salmonis]
MSDTVFTRNGHLPETRLLSDVSFLVRRDTMVESFQIIYVYKNILKSASTVFEEIYTGDLKKSKKENSDLEIKVKDMDPSGDMLRWIYTDEVTLSLNSVCSLLYSNEKYDLSFLNKMSISFITNAPSEDSCYFLNDLKLHCATHLVPWLIQRIVLSPSVTLSCDSLLEIKDSEVLNDILSY